MFLLRHGITHMLGAFFRHCTVSWAFCSLGDSALFWSCCALSWKSWLRVITWRSNTGPGVLRLWLTGWATALLLLSTYITSHPNIHIYITCNHTFLIVNYSFPKIPFVSACCSLLVRLWNKMHKAHLVFVHHLGVYILVYDTPCLFTVSFVLYTN